MKVLFVSSSRKGHGISPFVFAQGESLKNEGLNIDYYLLEGSGWINYFKSILSSRKIIKEGNYDLIHAHFGLSGIVAKMAAPKMKTVVSFLGDDLEGSVGKDGRYTIMSKILVMLNILFAKYFFNYNIVKSKSLLKKLGTNNNTIVIPNGVNLERFYFMECKQAKEKLRLEYNKKYILFAGNVNRTVKNHELFKDTMRYWEEDWEPLYLNNVNAADMVYYYNAASVVVMTSHHEGSPNVIKEAMSCNSSVVSTNVGDVKWLIDGLNGCFLSSQNPLEIAKKIKCSIEFSEIYKETNGRKRIIELKLDSVIVAKQIINVYQNVLS